MRKLRALVVVLVLTNLVVLGLLLARRAPARQGPPNVLLFTVDMLRADHLSCMGQTAHQTPAMDAIAARGMLFERAYAQCDITAQSYISMMTSRYPSEILADDAQKVACPTLAQFLKDRGYRTGAVLSVALLTQDTPLNESVHKLAFGQGFDDYFAVPPVAGQRLGETRRKGAESNAIALDWLGKQADRPWFLWMHYRDLHPPLEPPAEFGPTVSAEARYGACVSHVDSLIGEIMAWVKSAGLEENTTVVLASPHGVGLPGSRLSIPRGPYDSMVHVPLIVALPGGPRGKRVGGVVENLDVVPTLLKGGPGGFSGQDRSRGAGLAGYAFAQSAHLEVYMATDGRWKYVKYYRTILDPHDPNAKPPRPGQEELFDLSVDPGETTSLLARNRAQAEELRKVLAARFPGGPGRPAAGTIRLLKPLDYF
ncbi:MAG: sulfatase [Armatimonadetes bacterium]|nr:sulfatase [Armatimonadota bacterium]